MIAVVILAGGKSRRMGRDKLDIPVDGKTLLGSAVGRFEADFEDVFISVADEKKYPGVTARRIKDILPGAGPMSGLHAALSTLPHRGAFLVAADLPYACPQAAKKMIKLCGDCEACVIRLPDGKLEPLFGYYDKTLLGSCENAIRTGDYRMSGVLYGANTRFVDTEELGDLWDERLILNINYPEDFERIT